MVLPNPGKNDLLRRIPATRGVVSPLQLTQRDFLFLEDAMAAERLGVVQFRDMARHCTDQELRDLCLQAADQSLQHFGRLLNVLNRSAGGHGTFQASWHQNM